jgi:undecaprenyl-diphosphatase
VHLQVTLFQAVMLGILQGVTEFLPVSSSGHLFIVQRIFGLQGPALAFDLLLHLGTLFAIALFLHREIAEMAGSLFRRESLLNGVQRDAWSRRDILLVFVSTVPTAAIGLLLHDMVETRIGFRGVGVSYLLLTFVLLASNLRLRHKLDPHRIESWEALAIGIMQGLAVFPGLSRSGSTIALALVLGIGASRSAKYSFLIALPAIAGASIVGIGGGTSVLPGFLPSAAGFLVSLVASYLSLLVVERLVIRGRFSRFAPYTLLLAGLCFYLQARY